MVKEFEAFHPDIKVNVQFTDSYPETISKLIAAVQSKKDPHVVQIYEIGTRIMIYIWRISRIF